MHVLVALMDIFDCTADELISRVELGAAAATGTDGEPIEERPAASVLREKGLRPRRAEIFPRNDA